MLLRYGGQQIVQERAQIAVALIQRHPSGRATVRRRPQTGQAALAAAGRGRDQCQGLVKSPIKPIQQAVPRHNIRRHGRPMQFGIKDRSFHP
jgi:hypothetical protein